PIKPYENLFSHPFFFVFISCTPSRPQSRSRFGSLHSDGGKNGKDPILTRRFSPKRACARDSYPSGEKERPQNRCRPGFSAGNPRRIRRGFSEHQRRSDPGSKALRGLIQKSGIRVF
ncbi:MAG: hypothetical protein IIW14_01960, partial [Kiritimatiellae bacterium]|nr:hypothetical protein [Kiritimatiellia bacterium]